MINPVDELLILGGYCNSCNTVSIDRRDSACIMQELTSDDRFDIIAAEHLPWLKIEELRNMP